MEGNDLSDMSVNDIINKIHEMNPDLDSGSIGGFPDDGITSNQKPSISDDFWRGLPRFE
jgi:hypothetical protein